MYSVLVDADTFGWQRDDLMAALKEHGIDTRMLFKPLHSQALLAERGLRDCGDFPVSESLADKGLYFPSSTGLGAEKVEFIGATLRRLARR